MWQFYQVTGDLAYLIDYGDRDARRDRPILGQQNDLRSETDRYHIRGVIGPDEFHSGYPDRPFVGIDNNAYTNLMAVWVILRALDALQEVPLPNRWICARGSGGRHGTRDWDRVSRRMFVPFHDGLISQFEGYDALAELDWESYRARYGNIQRLTAYWRRKATISTDTSASKQADALMLLYLLSSDELRELLDRLGYESLA